MACSVMAICMVFATTAAAQDATSQAVPAQVSGGDVQVPAPPADVQLPEVETVISDEEFDSELPALEAGDDAALDAPLESIEEFEARLAREHGEAGERPPEEAAAVQTTEGSQAPLGDPALADGDPVEEIGDAPVRDSELAAPLPPLSSFDAEPVELAEDDSPDEETVEVAYQIEVNGLESVDDETETDLDGMFRDLAALRTDGRTAANVAQVSARLTEDSALLQRILASEGWYEAEVTTRLDRSGGSEDAGGDASDKLTAVLDVVPGQRFVFSDIVLDAPDVTPPDLLASNFALEVGEPIVAARVQGAEAQLAVALPQNGYPFAEIGQRDILLDQYTGEGAYTLPIDTGPRSVFGGIETAGDLAFDADHVEALARFEKGQLYDSDDVDDLRKALVATGLFNTVSVTAEKSGESAGMVEGPDGASAPAQYATILVDQEAGPPRTIAGSAGYGTGQGVRVRGSWSHRNMFPPEGALTFDAVIGTSEQGLGANFRRSNAGRRDRTFNLSANALHSDYDAFEAFTGRLAAVWSYDSTPIWQKRFTYAYGAQLIGTVEDAWDPEVMDRVDRTFFIGGLTGQAGIDFTDDLLNATKGFRLTALVEPEGSLQGGFTPYVRTRLDASAYFPATDSIVLAGRITLGSIQGIDRNDLAPSRRFYSGGGGSVRGFGYQELGPKSREPNPDYDPTDPDNDADEFDFNPLGGRSLNEAAAEVRYRFGNFGVVGFIDAGQVYEEAMPQFSDIRYGVGIGGRYYTNFGPLRLDVAMPIDRQEGESAFAVYISIGQAF